MKRTLFIMLVLMFAATGLFAQIELGDFPLGSWLDPNYDAVWELSSNNIRILSPSGELYYDFEGKTIEDFAPRVTGDGPAIRFFCVETAKNYELVKPLVGGDLILRITRESLPDYEVRMTRQ